MGLRIEAALTLRVHLRVFFLEYAENADSRVGEDTVLMFSLTKNVTFAAKVKKLSLRTSQCWRSRTSKEQRPGNEPGHRKLFGLGLAEYFPEALASYGGGMEACCPREEEVEATSHYCHMDYLLRLLKTFVSSKLK